MLSWLKSIDDFLGQYPHIVSATEALSTFAAVVVSLGLALLAQRANKTKLRAHVYLAGVGLLGRRDQQPPDLPQFIVVSITNTGNIPLRIPAAFMYWKIPFHRKFFQIVVPLDVVTGAFVQKRSYPIVIDPRTTERFQITTPQMFKDNMAKMREIDPWRFYLFRYFIAPTIQTEDGRRFKVKLAEEIREMIAAV